MKADSGHLFKGYEVKKMQFTKLHGRFVGCGQLYSEMCSCLCCVTEIVALPIQQQQLSPPDLLL